KGPVVALLAIRREQGSERERQHENAPSNASGVEPLVVSHRAENDAKQSPNSDKNVKRANVQQPPRSRVRAKRENDGRDQRQYVGFGSDSRKTTRRRRRLTAPLLRVDEQDEKAVQRADCSHPQTAHQRCAQPLATGCEPARWSTPAHDAQ